MSAPSNIILHRKSRQLELVWGEDHYRLDAEYLRVHSPSAEVRGHGQPILQTGKQGVTIESIMAVGNYALKLVFSDGHNSGLYTWDLLADLARNQDHHWQAYLQALDEAGASRDPDTRIVRLMDTSGNTPTE